MSKRTVWEVVRLGSDGKVPYASGNKKRFATKKEAEDLADAWILDVNVDKVEIGKVEIEIAII